MDELKVEDGAVEVEEVAVTGVIVDKYGNKWSIPAEELEDLDDLGAAGPLEKLKYDPNFHYQLERADRVVFKKMEGLVTVTRDELGIPEELVSEYGKPTSDIFQFGDGVMMKIPKVLADRRQKHKDAVAKAVRDAAEPTKAMLRRSKDRQAALTFGKDLSSLRRKGDLVEEIRKSSESGSLTKTYEKEEE